MARWTQTPAERFWQRVDKRGPKVWKSRCWVWTGATDHSGYPTGFSVGGVKVRPPRWVYETEVGTIPDGYTIDHLCRNRLCVRPSHLEAVPHGVNVRRAPRFKEYMARTHCINGHEYTPANTGWQGKNKSKRFCRECQRAANRRAYQRKQQQEGA